MPTLAEIESTALRLPKADRLHLVDALLGSLPFPFASGTDAEVFEEAKRRDDEIESGRTKALSETDFWNGVHRGK
ncbi:MAG: addiction module protein [Opitutaceae bacterium]|jgi:hypothetical protein|nr:addiction module protein [Opitutaceae bacterium]